MSRIDEYASRAYYERRGQLLGEDDDPYYCDECFGATSCRCDPHDEVIADPPERDDE